MKKIILGIVVAVIIAGGIVAKFKEKDANLKISPIREVAVEIVEHEFLAEENIFGSFVKNSEEAILLAQVGGNIDKFYINEGDYVRKGQVIAHISMSEISAQYAQVSAQVEISEQEEKRARRNWDDYKPEEREQFKLRNKQARASQAEVAAMLEKATVRAPFSGIISKKFTEEGSTVLTGMQLAYLVGNNKEKELEIAVPVNVGKDIVVGKVVLVKSEYIEEEAVVISVNPVSDNVSRKMNIKISLGKDSSFPLGLFVDVVFLVGNENVGDGVSVSRGSILKKYDEEFVFVIEGDKAKLQKVTVIGESDEKVLVTGISDDAKVIISGVHGVQDGEIIKVINK